MSQLQLGAQLMGQRRFAAALECFRRARALGARGFEVDFGLGSALLDTRQEAAAIVELERAAAQQPRHAGVRHNLAKAQYLLGLVDEAVANFRAARAVNDDALHRSSLATVIPGAPSATQMDVLEARRTFVQHDLPSPRSTASARSTTPPTISRASKASAATRSSAR